MYKISRAVLTRMIMQDRLSLSYKNTFRYRESDMIELNGTDLTIEQIVRVAREGEIVCLSASAREAIDRSREAVNALLASGSRGLRPYHRLWQVFRKAHCGHGYGGIAAQSDHQPRLRHGRLRCRKRRCGRSCCCGSTRLRADFPASGFPRWTRCLPCSTAACTPSFPKKAASARAEILCRCRIWC